MRRSRSIACSLALLLLAPAAGSAEEPTGEQIYREKCAACHGPNGAGTEDVYPEPLVGDRPLVDLTQFIVETMPEGAPQECVGEEAEKVAAYIYDAFYSPVAQARNRPPEIEFSRLTLRQYQNAVADLAGSFRREGEWDDERGLEAEYYKSRVVRNRDKVFERIDAAVDFDFGEGSPEPEKLEAEQFAVSWEGAVLAPETGDYEFVVETENGARLCVNDTERPLIDAVVKSGDQTEYRKTVRLLGGRVYPLRLEFHKSKRDKSASIRLKWKRPHHAESVIPHRLLSPNEFRQVLVVETPFPPDDRSTGFERGTSISKAWDQATTYAAIEVAGKVVADLEDLADSEEEDAGHEERLREFCRQFAERAFRRPLSDAERRFFVDRQFEAAPDRVTAVKRVVLLALKSPRFLYRGAGVGRFDAYDTAAWLSFALWDSLPDEQLLEAAANGELETRAQIAAQAERMLADVRARSKVREFLHQWLGVNRFHDLSKDSERYPEFDEAIVSDLMLSLDLFLDEVVWSEASDFRQILLAETVYLNGRLAEFYGVDLPADAAFQPVSLDPQVRAGIVSHPYLMTGFAYHSTSSPIHRGVFLARSVLGRFLKPPPEAVTPLAPDLHPDLTTRERVSLQTDSVSCRKCHGLINPLGFSLEHFDAVGRYREQEKDRPIDAAGFYVTQSGEAARFTGARELAEFLAGSEEVHE
ncbi:MAG: DUF1592 domain-containing protein, partial [Planctomycetaceae bacterium]